MASALDKLTAAKNSLAGDQVNLTVCKATNHDVLSPKRKHVEVLLAWSNNPALSIPDLADRLFSRVAETNWIVVFKAMIVSHEIMAKGGERFIQNLASRSSTFNVGSFLDKGNIMGYDMSPFIRRYGHYLNEKALAYRQMGYDFCRLKKTANGTELRSMDSAKLMKALPVMQKLIDGLVDFQVQQGDLGNPVIGSAFLLMFKDLVKLFACYNDAIINLLEKFFEMKKPQAKEALDIYKKFLVRMDSVSEFLKVAENIGVHKEELPDLSKAPSTLLTALENHVQSLDKKPNAASPARPAASGQANVKVGSLTLPASTAAALGMTQDGAGGVPTVQSSPSLPPPGQSPNQQAALEKKRHLEAERDRLMQLKQQQQGVGMMGSVSQPAVSIAQQAQRPAVNPLEDLAGLSFGGAAPAPAPAAMHTAVPHGGIDDLYAQPTKGLAMQAQQQQQQPPQQQPQAFPAAAASTNPFGTAGQDLFASSQAPALSAAPAPQQSTGGGSSLMGEILQPQVMGEFGTKEEPKKAGLGKDLDSSLSIAAQGLTLNGQMPRKQQQFQPQPKSGKTGGANWTPIQQTSTVAPAMGTGMAPGMASGGWAAGGGMGMQQPVAGGAVFGAAPAANPMASMGGMGMQPAMGGMASMGGMQQPVMGGYGAPMGMHQQQPMGGFGGAQMASQDPFGPVPGAQSHF